MIFSPVGPSLVNAFAPPHLRGRYNAVGGLAWGVSRRIGPAIAGVVIGRGWGVAWALGLAVGCLLAGVILRSLRHLLTAEEDGRGRPVPGVVGRGGRMTPMTSDATLAPRLRADIERSGYYPELVSDTLDTALAARTCVSYVVHHEATFDHDELRRHVTVLALTPTRLIVGHTDEHPPDETSTTAYATASTEAVRLERIDSVVVTRIAADAATHRRGAPVREVVLTIGWGAVSRIDLEPASCGDPSCDADHGYTGTASNDDLALRVSEAADGAEVVAQTLVFAGALSQATAPARADPANPLSPRSLPPMAELVFFSGTMDCGKSTLALQTDHNHAARGRAGRRLHLARPRRRGDPVEPARAQHAGRRGRRRHRLLVARGRRPRGRRADATT